MGVALGEWSTNRKRSTSTADDIAVSGRLLFTGLLAATLPLLSAGFQFAVAFRVDILLTHCQHVQSDIVLAIHVLLDQAFRIFQ